MIDWCFSFKKDLESYTIQFSLPEILDYKTMIIITGLTRYYSQILKQFQNEFYFEISRCGKMVANGNGIKQINELIRTLEKNK